MRGGLWVAVVALVGLAGCAPVVQFTDTFSTSPAAAGRTPFGWDRFFAGAGAGSVWRVADGVLEYRADNSTGSGAHFSFTTAGMKLTDDSAWSLEVGFRHVAGTAPRPEYETLAYITWHAKQQGRMRILALVYDAEGKALVLVNGDRKGQPFAADLSGRFHPVRITAADGQVCVYVDGERKAGPLTTRSRAYSQAPGCFIGPITSGDRHTLHYQFDYFAFTTQGALPPGSRRWTPAADREPVARGLKTVRHALNQKPYPGITVLKRHKGSTPWDQAIPEHWRTIGALIKKEPRKLNVPFYTYDGKQPPQNIYRSSMPLRYDGNRCVAIAHLTRGTDDTGPGFIDYKLWYHVSTDGGKTYDKERPLVVSGEGYSPAHPNPYVWIGKNSFCYASVPPFLTMSNGEALLPIYYAPLDEKGNYYNPVNAFTFTFVAALIGTWNAAGDDVVWEMSDDVRCTPEQSSRGTNECAVIELSKPGHILIVIRGSNLPNPKGVIPAVKWKSLSTDYGRTWSKISPLTYSDGEEFLSPSSCSSFIRSSRTGKVYWIGNISRTLPRGNPPRYPLIIAELDEKRLALRRKTVTIIDDRGPTDPPELQLSNFGLIEHPTTGHIIVKLGRYMAAEHADHPDAGTHTYVIEVTK